MTRHASIEIRETALSPLPLGRGNHAAVLFWQGASDEEVMKRLKLSRTAVQLLRMDFTRRSTVARSDDA